MFAKRFMVFNTSSMKPQYFKLTIRFTELFSSSTFNILFKCVVIDLFVIFDTFENLNKLFLCCMESITK
ncbi:hypothetical protein A9G49_21835 [Aeromonas sp. ANP5]|nr:hypothetical protein A9G04_21765 [Aeromonas sp. ANNP30]OEC59554.1 hypothetical protein A9G49_21835 [Aeromonas sp. ANP5]